MRPSNAPARSSRLAGAAGALLLQGGFLLLFLASVPQIVPPMAPVRELVFTLPRLARTLAPPPTSSQAPARGLPPAVIQAPQPTPPAPAIAPPLVAVPDLKDFGQALNNCAPEKYQSLTPDQKTLCPRPGAGMAMRDSPPLFRLPSEAKDHDDWQEQWDEAHWMPGLCGPDQGSSVVDCLMQQKIAEYEREMDVRYRLTKAKAVGLQQPKRPLPPNISTAKPGSIPAHAAKQPG